ncbi:gephyrin-like molybdotransferase Glp [Halomonas sp. NO4]|uniref:molybdopterin molybdotransferase MoeA n=1 Tax=Halomonas sp. NO4 TaxID=2484813 RepID=UPI0013D74256|nr:gephyrin-like molybdotransferase Glp [Halomonas sp. NO4]
MADGNPLQSVEAALAALLADVAPLDAERIECDRAAGRVLAEAVTATLDVPPFDNSAMDGYALHHADAGQALPVTQRITAGTSPSPLPRGECARIFTGGEIPPGADCVVMQEAVTLIEENVQVTGDIPAGNNVRRRGRDVAAGAPLLPAGQWLEAAALGHLAGQGITTVTVRRRPRVALLSTGDEIVAPGEPLGPGQIYNSNRPMLERLLTRFGAEVVMQAAVPDSANETRRLLRQAAECADVVVTTGGVSVGEADHVKAAVGELGQLDLWRIAMRPGKPLALGRLPRRGEGGEARFVGLPGNPVSTFVGAWLFLRPLLGALLDCPKLAKLPTLTARAAFAAETGPRRHFLRVRLEFGPEGILAHAFRDQNSAVLASCIEADALAVIAEHGRVKEGDAVHCLWLQLP